MKHLFYLNKFFLRYRWRFLLGIIFVSASNYFRVWQPRVIRDALDLVIEKVEEYKQITDVALQETFMSDMGGILLKFGGTVLLLALIMGVFMYFMRQTIIVMSRLIEYDLRKEIFSHYEDLPLSFYKVNKTGDMMSRITEDVNKVRMYLGPAILYFINLTTLIVLTISSMLSVNVELSLYVLAPLPFLSFSIYYVSNIINKRSERIQKQLARLNSIAQEVYSGIRVVKSYVQEKPMTGFFKKESEAYKEEALGLAKVNAAFFPLMILLIGASSIITVYVGGLQVAKGTLTAGNIAEFVIYVNMLTWPVTSIGWIASLVQQAAASQKRINEFLHTKTDIISGNKKVDQIQGQIEFDKVRFTYPHTGIEAIKDISFHLKPGDKMAVIGKTGSGKSSIADLLVRMYDASQGEIRIDGQSIQDYDLSSLRQRIGYAPQDVFLFSDTIGANISFGKENANIADIEKFAKLAAIHKDIIKLPKGFDTMVGERGVTLSGGQKQRISIARTFLKEPDIIVLDDCLSAVDTHTEKQILSYFSQTLSDKTAVIITHRIYSFIQFDQIIVLDDGTIVESGTHEDLLEQKGYYYDLFQKQIREEMEVEG